MTENDEPALQNKVEKLFGKKALSNALFYNHENALRFELSGGGSYIEQFQTAFRKSSQILKYAFKDSKDIFVCISFYANTVGFLDNMRIFKALKDCEISIPKSSYTTWQTFDEDADIMRVFISYPLKPDDLDKYLWGVFAQELSIKPALECSAYFIDFENNIIAHPYDDRGMDIIGSNTNLLADLYEKFYDYLLEYDLERMKNNFGHRV